MNWTVSEFDSSTRRKSYAWISFNPFQGLVCFISIECRNQCGEKPSRFFHLNSDLFIKHRFVHVNRIKCEHFNNHIQFRYWNVLVSLKCLRLQRGSTSNFTPWLNKYIVIFSKRTKWWNEHQFFLYFLSSWFYTSVFERNFVAKIVHTSAAVAGFVFFPLFKHVFTLSYCSLSPTGKKKSHHPKQI